MDPDRVDLNRVAMFVRIAEAGGVTAAAAALKLPKSSVSRSLTQLEAELGVELVVRNRRRFDLTDAGRVFYEAASSGIATVTGARDELRQAKDEPHGIVRIAAPADIATSVLPPVITAFVRTYPKVQIELTVTGRPVDPVRDGFDVVLATGPLADSSAKVRSIGSADGGVFATAAYLRERGTPRRLSDLAAHDCILRGSSGRRDRWKMSGPSGIVEVTVDGHLRVDDLFGATALAAADGGLIVLPLHGASASDPRLASFVRVLPDYVVVGGSAQLLYAAHRHPPLRVSLLCDAISAHAVASCPSKRLERVARPAAAGARR
ncbi:MAG: LysR family transcriptional regulator [Labilithrix sp.]|nr:LysR family transcriptional regulator [Labilithrix sp.]